VSIQSDDPFKQPRIVTNYLCAQHDRNVMVDAIKILRRINAQPSFCDQWDTEVVPGSNVETDEQILNAAIPMHPH